MHNNKMPKISDENMRSIEGSYKSAWCVVGGIAVFIIIIGVMAYVAKNSGNIKGNTVLGHNSSVINATSYNNTFVRDATRMYYVENGTRHGDQSLEMFKNSRKILRIKESNLTGINILIYVHLAFRKFYQ